MEINDIKYGNPTERLAFLSSKNNKLLSWFYQSKNFNKILKLSPSNNSVITKNDISTILDKMSNVSQEDILFAEAAEEDFTELFIVLVRDRGFHIPRKNIDYIINQTDPLLFSLKDKINRPRPAQLAYYMGIELFPLIHSDANSAAFPSGHTLDSKNVCRYLCLKFPSISKELMDLQYKISQSRIYTGLHYPSDEEVSLLISDIIWNNQLLNLK